MPQQNNQSGLPVIVGIKNPKTLQFFQNMLRAVGVPKGVTQIIVGNPIEFQKAQRAFGIKYSHPAFSVYNMGRIYIPDEVLDNPNLIDKYLLHEFGHFFAGAYSKSGSQQNLSEEQREAMEQAAEKGAQSYRDAFKLYQSKVGKSYQSEQSRIDSDQGKIQPTPAPVSTTLVAPDETEYPAHPPMSARVRKIMAEQPAPDSHVARIMASAPQRSYAERVMAEMPDPNVRVARIMATNPNPTIITPEQNA